MSIITQIPINFVNHTRKFYAKIDSLRFLRIIGIKYLFLLSGNAKNKEK